MKKTLLSIAIIAFSGNLMAMKWSIVGGRALGMGGAGVAAVKGPDAQYWNPAGLVKEEKVNETGGLIGVGAQIEPTKKVLTTIDQLKGVVNEYDSISQKIKNGGAATASEVSAVFKGLSSLADLNYQDIGAIINADAGLGIKINNLAFSVRGYNSSGVTPIIDSTNIGFGAGGTDTGITLGNDTQGSMNAGQIADANALAAAITQSGTAASLATLLNYTGSGGAQGIANALVNMAVSAGATQAQLDSMIGAINEYLPTAAPLINSAASGNYTNNQSQVFVESALFAEFAVGYALEATRGVKVGGNLKVINGYVAQAGVMLLDNRKDIGDVIRDAYNNKKQSTNFGIDLGVLVDFNSLLNTEIPFGPQFGLTMRNINNPKFERPSRTSSTNPNIVWKNADYELNPQMRAGVAVTPLKFLTVAADLDLTSNSTDVNNFNSRQFALGVEVNVINSQSFNIPLRAGANWNLASSQSATMYTLGAGLNMMHFMVELAGGVSTDTTIVDGTELPNCLAGSLTISLLF